MAGGGEMVAAFFALSLDMILLSKETIVDRFRLGVFFADYVAAVSVSWLMVA